MPLPAGKPRTRRGRGTPAGHRADPSAFARARGPLPRLAAPLSQRARARRVLRFRELTGATAETRIVDVGCGGLGLISLAPDLAITGVDLYDRPEYPGPLVRADATQRLPFADDEFDLAYASSVIEHIAPDRRRAFADEVRRVARGWYVQTPAIAFPVEPHSLLPAAHWLPIGIRRRYWRLGAGSDVDEIQLLPRRELESLFGPAIPERFGPLTKSWISARPPA
jgi:SAM-dependent methyltransferase